MPGVDAGIQLYGGLLINKGYEPHQHLWNNKPTLIYIISAAGFFIKSNPFLGVRIIELCVFTANLFLIRGIVKHARLQNTAFYCLSFCALYLVSWDEGALPEVFNIPLVLLAVYLFLRRIPYFELAAALLMLLSFMLKQNAFAVIGGLMIIDVFSNYRVPGSLKKMMLYAIAIAIWLTIGYSIINAYGAWDDFLYQTIIYNGRYADRLPLVSAVTDHIRHNSFLSVKGISLIMILNACMVVTLYHFYKKYRQRIALSFPEKFILCAILVYIPAYVLTYIPGKSHPHYYMLLIVPATFVLGRYMTATVLGKIAVISLLVYGCYTNFRALRYNQLAYESKKEIAAFLKENTAADERIHIVGPGNQYMYVMADRLSHTKFVIHLFENHGYQPADKATLTRDFTERLPKYMVMNRNLRRPPDPNNFYFIMLNQALKNYSVVFRNDDHNVYQLNAAR